jgi:predicted negative regulator of RcsB-dependent stress response
MKPKSSGKASSADGRKMPVRSLPACCSTQRCCWRQVWFAYQDRKAEEASNIHFTLMNALAKGEEALVTDRAGMLIGQYTKTPYATLAALALAKQKLEQGELEAAHAQLQWALDKAGSDALRQLIRLRLTRVMVAEGNLDGAGALLAQSPPESAFAPLSTNSGAHPRGS